MHKKLIEWLVIAAFVAAFSVLLSLHGFSFLSFAQLLFGTAVLSHSS